MSDTAPDRVIERIRKLLAVANQGAGRVNENEAAVAASMAQTLAAEYNLELAQLESNTANIADVAEKREKTPHDRSAMYLYQQRLMASVAKLYFCRYFLTEVERFSFGKMRRTKQHVLLGRKVNVLSATMIYDYLVDTMDKLCPWQGTALRGKDALAFFDGCAERLAARLEDKRRALEAESEAKRRDAETRARHPSAAPAGNALVLADVYSSEDDYNADAMRGVPPGTTARERREATAKYAAQEAERQRLAKLLIAQGMDPLADADEIWTRSYYCSRGYSQEAIDVMIARDRARKAEQAVTVPEKEETEAQRRARQAREERENAKSNQRYWRAQSKEAQRRSNPAFQAGYQTGAQIGLDQQVKSETRKGIR